jgi:hypothetical protein
MEKIDAENTLEVESKPKLKGEVNLQKFLKHFERHGVRSTVDVGIFAKAFIFYSLGIILFPTRSATLSASFG